MIFWWKEERGEIRAIAATQNSCSFWEMEILSNLKPFRRLITWLQNGGYCMPMQSQHLSFGKVHWRLSFR